MLHSHLPQRSKSRAKAGVCVGAILDPRGKFRERSGPSVAPVAKDNGGIVASVSDGSAFGENKHVNAS